MSLKITEGYMMHELFSFTRMSRTLILICRKLHCDSKHGDLWMCESQEHL